MARLSLAEHLQNFAFQVLDVAPISPRALPVFTPGSSFSGVSSPEITAEMQDIPEGNSLFTKRVIKRGEISSITLQRGATAGDSDFYRWMMVALTGRPRFFGGRTPVQIGGPSARRTLLLVHFYRHSILPQAATAGLAGAASAAVSGILSGIEGGVATGVFAGGVTAVGAGVGAAVGAAAGPGSPLPVGTAVRLPARAWLLQGCLPQRYKAGTDFDATSSDVSIMELELAVESVQEYALGAIGVPVIT